MRRKAKTGDRIIVRGTPARGYIIDRIDNVVLIVTDDSIPARILRVSDVAVINA